jgi:hypothetical protein
MKSDKENSEACRSEVSHPDNVIGWRGSAAPFKDSGLSGTVHASTVNLRLAGLFAHPLVCNCVSCRLDRTEMY